MYLRVEVECEGRVVGLLEASDRTMPNAVAQLAAAAQERFRNDRGELVDVQPFTITVTPEPAPTKEGKS